MPAFCCHWLTPMQLKLNCSQMIRVRFIVLQWKQSKNYGKCRTICLQFFLQLASVCVCVYIREHGLILIPWLWCSRKKKRTKNPFNVLRVAALLQWDFFLTASTAAATAAAIRKRVAHVLDHVNIRTQSKHTHIHTHALDETRYYNHLPRKPVIFRDQEVTAWFLLLLMLKKSSKIVAHLICMFKERY